MSKLEYLNPSDWSLHVIDGENECVPEGWLLIPNEASEYRSNDRFYKDGGRFFYSSWGEWVEANGVEYRTVWSRKMKEYLVERDCKYELVEAYHLDGGVEVPEGACVLKIFKGFEDDLCFYKENYTHIWQDHMNPKCWDKLADDQKIITSDNGVILWQRNPSLSDQSEEIEEVRQDSNVSNPKHYTSHPSGIECIEITRHHDFAIGNAIKYLWRAGLKDSDNEIQDLEKAAWYIQDKIKQLKGGK